MKRNVFSVSILICVSALALAIGNKESQTMNTNQIEVPAHFVDGEWLAGLLHNPNLVVLDTGRDENSYLAAHIPGAQFVDRGVYYAEVDGIPGMFPGVSSVKKDLEALGISNDSAVVIYDMGHGLWAARLAWTLAYLGHKNWAVLDGGWSLWSSEARPSDMAISPPKPGTFTVTLQEELIVTDETIVTNLDDPDFLVVDARSPEEYTGEKIQANRGGHIPGALNIDWVMNNTDGGLPKLLSVDELANIYESRDITPDKKVITHCQTGVRGAYTWLVLTHLGYPSVALYDGSWVEWGNNEDLPVVQ